MNAVKKVVDFESKTSREFRKASREAEDVCYKAFKLEPGVSAVIGLVRIITEEMLETYTPFYKTEFRVNTQSRIPVITFSSEEVSAPGRHGNKGYVSVASGYHAEDVGQPIAEGDISAYWKRLDEFVSRFDIYGGEPHRFCRSAVRQLTYGHRSLFYFSGFNEESSPYSQDDKPVQFHRLHADFKSKGGLRLVVTLAFFQEGNKQ